MCAFIKMAKFMFMCVHALHNMFSRSLKSFFFFLHSCFEFEIFIAENVESYIHIFENDEGML